MRIIAGRFKGRRLFAPKGDETRPMLDRVKESVFNILGAELEDAAVLDLFSGSGALGLEALSRGARRVRFVEESKEARKALRRNCEALGLGSDEVDHQPGDALLAEAWREPGAGRWADVAFLDPPYPIWRAAGDRRTMLSVCRAVLDEALVPDGVLVLHVPPGELDAADLGLPAGAEPRRYGQSELWFVRAPDEAEEGAQGTA
ncbi:MAG: 16S rRNA (guanine(966)-N(2))-methyltransferase RsmD [Planctomycetota bacterium]